MGAGLGLPSLAAAALGADVIATDCNIATLERLTSAASAQGLRLEGAQWRLEDGWGALERRCDARPPSLGAIIVAADLLYSPELANVLALRCAEAVRGGACALVADSIGMYFEHFEDALEAALGGPACFRTEQCTLSHEAPSVARGGAWQSWTADVRTLVVKPR